MKHKRLQSFTPRRSARRASRRRGAVLVETALVLPLLLLLCFGVMEFGHLVYTRHTLEGAAQQGARIAILPDATQADVEAAVERVMSSSGISSEEYTVTYAEATPDNPHVTVTVTCDWGNVGVRPMGLMAADKALTGTVTARKEGP